MSKIFMSYSHADEALRDKLEKHLSLMKRQGLVSTWHDRKILAGDKFKAEIDSNLEDSNLILLLVSPDFIASDYCYDIEMKRALELNDSGETRVIPIILEHCDWQGAPFGELLALPNDGRPVTDFPNQNKALTEIAKKLRRILEKVPVKIKSPKEDLGVSTDFVKRSDPHRSSNLRVKKRFTDKEKDDFIKESFEYIFKFIKNSLDELRKRYPFTDYDISPESPRVFTVRLYSDDNLMSQCQIWIDSDYGGSETIKYSTSPGSRNSFNELVTVMDDGYQQYLQSSGMLRLHTNNQSEKNLSAKGVAELFWTQLIEPLQRSR